MRKLQTVMLGLLCCFCLTGTLYAAEGDGWVSLFDGKTLNGWKANENPDAFVVRDGMICTNGDRCHMFYVGDVNKANFKNFEFKADVMAGDGANSGVFFHTEFQKDGWPNKGYEVQVDNDEPEHEGYKENKLTGSLYGIRNFYKQIVNDNEWFTLYISVKGKHVQIKVNDMLVVDYVEEDKPFRPGRTTNWVLSSGTFALQCHDPKSKAFYKNIMVKPLPDDASDAVTAPVVDDLYKQMIELGADNFPLIDLHGHLKGGLGIDELTAYGRKYGITYGAVVNCGKGFPIDNDKGILNFLEEMKGKPAFLGLQVEGREWVNLISKEAAAQFDYIFTDSMTWTDDKGRRMRIWMPDETFVDDKQQFMDMLVSRAVGILNNEPINIYVNPTYLPDSIAKEYDQLWTEERMMKVINAAAKHNIAIEINSRFKLPSATFIKLAKKAGCKFTLGTNNGGKDDLGRLEYSLQMVKECGLTAKDMFVPKPKIRK